MSDRMNELQMQMEKLSADESSSQLERHVINCRSIGPLNVYVQGSRSSSEVVVLTVHDLGCDHTQYMEFIAHPRMMAIRSRTVWVHVEVPGQGHDAEDLAPDYQYPTMQQIGEDLIFVLDELKLKGVICFGEGAGANILARFAAVHVHRVLGVCLLHATATSASFFESIKDKGMGSKLHTTGMNPSTEKYLLMHRFGTTSFTRKKDKEELKPIAESFQSVLRHQANAKNLRKFVEAFLKRSSMIETVKKLTCPVLLLTGQQSIFNNTTKALHLAILKAVADRTKVEFVEVAGVANVLEEKPDKLVECFQYFLQGLGLVSSVPMLNVSQPVRGRSMSMQEYDMPMRQRLLSAQFPLQSYSPPSPYHEAALGKSSDTTQLQTCAIAE